MKTKYCPRCKNTKSVEEFPKSKNRKDGLGGHCKVCCAEKNKIYRQTAKGKATSNANQAKRRNANKIFLYEYLLKHPCVKCGEADIRCLEFNHLDPSKKHKEVTNMTEYSRKRLKEEIAKCEILCANCHNKHTYQGSMKEQYLIGKGIVL